MRICRLLTLEDMEAYQEVWAPLIKSYKNKQHSQAPDAIIKWSSMLDCFEEVYDVSRGGKVVDVGSGGSHISLIFLDRWMDSAVAIDPRRTPDICRDKENMESINEGFLSWASRQPDNSVDVFLDGCAVIHFAFDGVSTVTKCAEEINRILSPGGVFVVASDVCLQDDSPEPDGRVEMYNFKNLFNLFEAGGLVPIEESIEVCNKQKFIVDSMRKIAVARMVFRKGR